MPVRVLVVDDEPEVRNAVRRGLELMGYAIDLAMPIIVLSVMGKAGDKVRALDAGAHDYRTKPFGVQELVTRKNEPVHLTPSEYEVFKHLALAAGHVLTHQRLLNRVWGEQYAQEAYSVRPVVTTLPKKLGSQLIKTEAGVGYRLSASADQA
jgi:two-component system KDP operon response regulator KdpE